MSKQTSVCFYSACVYGRLFLDDKSAVWIERKKFRETVRPAINECSQKCIKEFRILDNDDGRSLKSKEVLFRKVFKRD